MKKRYIMIIASVLVMGGFALIMTNSQLENNPNTSTISRSTKETQSNIDKDNYFIKEYYTSKYARVKKTTWDRINVKDNEHSAEEFLNVEDYLDGVPEYIKKDVIKTIGDRINVKGSGYDTAEEFLDEVDYYVEAIAKYIKRENWKDIYKERHGENFDSVITFSFTSKRSYAFYNTLEIHLNIRAFKTNLSVTPHEITHLIAPYSSSLSLSEGLACLIQDRLGKQPTLFHYRESLFPLSKQFLEEENKDFVEGMIEAIGVPTEDIPSNVMSGINGDKTTRIAFYLMSQSYSTYLIDEYGIEKFMEVYYAEDLYAKYEEIYEKDIEELRQQWIDYVMEYKADN
ncbi:hypothetical protein [Alkaliphilus hydrothermalis]|uniref:Peptidase MA-like domain-containing protein n=1 Tax=Alkaliphilus hydrothermalis TaxID=1482730 RepID=A0ABS2NLQ6_9FIRM|nr:hypothetical protein [Alkaliphilus hydrothermalis]MBM7613867.1 hypothetical protein [Alkaliphilus hydrothermalis]